MISIGQKVLFLLKESEVVLNRFEVSSQKKKRKKRRKRFEVIVSGIEVVLNGLEVVLNWRYTRYKIIKNLKSKLGYLALVVDWLIY